MIFTTPMRHREFFPSQTPNAGVGFNPGGAEGSRHGQPLPMALPLIRGGTQLRGVTRFYDQESTVDYMVRTTIFRRSNSLNDKSYGHY